MESTKPITPAKRSDTNRFGLGRDWEADFPDELDREAAKRITMRTILQKIAYPRYGTEEMNHDRQHFADLIQSFFSVEDLE